MNVGKEIKNICKRPSFFLSKKKANNREKRIYKRTIKLITDNQKK
jgi:ribosomal protein S10